VGGFAGHDKDSPYSGLWAACINVYNGGNFGSSRKPGA